jgi:hypothetical protein
MVVVTMRAAIRAKASSEAAGEAWPTPAVFPNWDKRTERALALAAPLNSPARARVTGRSTPVPAVVEQYEARIGNVVEERDADLEGHHRTAREPVGRAPLCPRGPVCSRDPGATPRVTIRRTPTN